MTVDTGMMPGTMGMVTPERRACSTKRKKAVVSKKNWVIARVAPASILAFSTSMSCRMERLSGCFSG